MNAKQIHFILLFRNAEVADFEILDFDFMSDAYEILKRYVIGNFNVFFNIILITL